MKRILVTRATGQIGSEVISQLGDTGSRICAMSRNPHSANLPPDVEIVPGDLSAPDTLDACLNGIDSVFLGWIAPLAGAAPVTHGIARRHVCRPAACEPLPSPTPRAISKWRLRAHVADVSHPLSRVLLQTAP